MDASLLGTEPTNWSVGPSRVVPGASHIGRSTFGREIRGVSHLCGGNSRIASTIGASSVSSVLLYAYLGRLWAIRVSAGFLALADH